MNVTGRRKKDIEASGERKKEENEIAGLTNVTYLYCDTEKKERSSGEKRGGDAHVQRSQGGEGERRRRRRRVPAPISSFFNDGKSRQGLRDRPVCAQAPGGSIHVFS